MQPMRHWKVMKLGKCPPQFRASELWSTYDGDTSSAETTSSCPTKNSCLWLRMPTTEILLPKGKRRCCWPGWTRMPLLIFPENSKRVEFQIGGSWNKLIRTVEPENRNRFQFFDLNFGIVFHFTASFVVDWGKIVIQGWLLFGVSQQRLTR